MKVSPEQLAARLEQGLAPVYLLAGPERLIVEEAADAVRRACRERQVAERVRLTVDAGFQWQELGQATETGSLFASQRLIELRLPTGKPGNEGGKVLREWVATDRDDILLVICDQWEMNQEKSAWCKAIDKVGVYLPAWRVKPHQLPGWIGGRLRRTGFEADSRVCQFLASRLEGNLLAAAQEVDRLALLYPAGPLTLDQVRAAVADSARFDAFRLAELALTGQSGAALRCIRVLRESGTTPYGVLWALGREIEIAHQILNSREPAAQIFRSQQVWPARQKPIDDFRHRLGRAAVTGCMQAMAELDLQIKGQAPGDFWVSLERFVVRLAQSPARSAA